MSHAVIVQKSDDRASGMLNAEVPRLRHIVPAIGDAKADDSGIVVQNALGLLVGRAVHDDDLERLIVLLIEMLQTGAQPWGAVARDDDDSAKEIAQDVSYRLRRA